MKYQKINYLYILPILLIPWLIQAQFSHRQSKSLTPQSSQYRGFKRSETYADGKKIYPFINKNDCDVVHDQLFLLLHNMKPTVFLAHCRDEKSPFFILPTELIMLIFQFLDNSDYSNKLMDHVLSQAPAHFHKTLNNFQRNNVLFRTIFYPWPKKISYNYLGKIAFSFDNLKLLLLSSYVAYDTLVDQFRNACAQQLVITENSTQQTQILHDLLEVVKNRRYKNYFVENSITRLVTNTSPLTRVDAIKLFNCSFSIYALKIVIEQRDYNHALVNKLNSILHGAELTSHIQREAFLPIIHLDPYTIKQLYQLDVAGDKELQNQDIGSS